MRKLSLTIFILITGNLFAILLYSCRCKTDVSGYCFDLQSVSIEAQDNGGLEPGAVINNTVYAKALILSITAHDVKYECRRSSLNFYNAAFAMCKGLNYKFNYSKQTMLIFLNRDYDKMHPAGTDLKDLFIQKGDDYYLMSAPDDTMGTFIFTVQLEYEVKYKQKKDTLFASAPPLKLKK